MAKLSRADKDKPAQRESMHETVRVRVGEREAEIDKAIAPLIRELWKADIETVMSCEGSPQGWVWVEFFTFRDAEEFLSIAANQYEAEPPYECLYQRIARQWQSTAEPYEADDWQYEVHPEDISLIWRHDFDGVHVGWEPDGPAELVLCVSVRFPRRDLPAVMMRLREFNDGACDALLPSAAVTQASLPFGENDPAATS
jgi:hypothetical protein